jgi:chorismate dehydratase
VNYTSITVTPANTRPIRIASVGFINSRPLIEGLDQNPHVRMTMAVPSKLIGILKAGEADVALLPTIDYHAIDGLRIIPSGGIGCFGPTLTVRLFSHVPVKQITSVVCDSDSHTSVALAKILFTRLYETSPSFVDMKHAISAPGEARLLIGDKVICEEPLGFQHQIDLGEAWKQLTGLPFVFAIWCAMPEVDLGDLPAELEQARKRGLANAQKIVEKYAVPRGWPAGIALQYLTMYLNYDIGPRQLEAIRTFHGYAAELGLLTGPKRPLDIVEAVSRSGGLWEND